MGYVRPSVICIRMTVPEIEWLVVGHSWDTCTQQPPITANRDQQLETSQSPHDTVVFVLNSVMGY